MVKSFYNFLNDGRLRYGWTPIILNGQWLRKISLFNWLACDNKILTLENLALRKCNRLHSITFVMCHLDIESMDHLLFQCHVAFQLWHFFGQLLGLRNFPMSIFDLRGAWRKNIRKPHSFLWDLLARAITWNIWLERNNSLILKITHLFLLRFFVVPDSKKARLEEPVAKVKRSLKFLSSRDAILCARLSPPRPLASCNIFC